MVQFGQAGSLRRAGSKGVGLLGLELKGKYFDGQRFEPATITIERGTIASVDPAVPSEDDLLLMPSFVDVHVHGGAGHDFADADVEGALEVARFHASRGTGALIASVVSSGRDETLAAIEAIREAKEREDRSAAAIEGVHLEGPWISPRRAGAHSETVLRLPEVEELESWIVAAEGMALYVTIAPELDGALSMIETHGGSVSFSIGHTDCDYSTALDAISRGARGFTHLFNAMKPLHHRQPGPVGAAIVSPDAAVELIADGVHLHPVVIRMIARLAATRALLVTDAMRAAGKGDGLWRLGDLAVEVHDGQARLESGALAGSVLTMDAAVRNMVELAGVPLELAVPMATSNPASFASLTGKGRIVAGYDADIVVLNDRLELEQIFLRGEPLR